jgi:hypothetical protein
MVVHTSVRRYLLLTLLLATLASQGGCQWLRQTFRFQDPQPLVLRQGAGLEEVIAAVNRNNSQIQSLYSDSATLKSPGYPTLKARFAYQRPNYFRLRAETGLTGPEADLGSNPELFWFWIKRNEPPAVYFCRHDQYATSRARQILPIQPTWLIDALGTLEIDPNLHHDGPYPDQGNRVQIRTILDTPEGPNMKVTVIDSVSAWVMEQRIYDSRGQLRARSVTEGYRLDPQSKLYVPTAIQVECPPRQFSMRIDLGNVQVNQPLCNQGELWTLPNIPSAPLVNLGTPSPQYASPGLAAGR